MNKSLVNRDIKMGNLPNIKKDKQIEGKNEDDWALKIEKDVIASTLEQIN